MTDENGKKSYEDGVRDQRLAGLERRTARLEAGAAFIIAAIVGAWANVKGLWGG